MDDEVEHPDQEAPTSPPTAQFDYLQPPGQRNALTNAAEQRHGLCLRFESQYTSNGTKSSRATRPDTFNAVEAVRGLADALFTSRCNVIIHDTSKCKTMKDLTEWPADDKDFTSFFEVHIPSNRKATAFVRFAISSSRDYKNLKKDGLLYLDLRTNSIFMTLHQFADIETTNVGILLFKHPKMTHWQRYREMLLRQMHHALHYDQNTHTNNPFFLIFDFTDTTVPYFTISDRTIRHTLPSLTDTHNPDPDQPQDNNTIHSTVFEAPCGKNDQQRLTTLLQAFTANPATKFHSGMFVPTTTRNQDSLTFFNLLATQNDFLANIQAVSVSGIAPQFWHTTNTNNPNTAPYSTEILAIPEPNPATPEFKLIQWVEETQDTATAGQYMFIYHTQHEHQVFRFLETTFVVKTKITPRSVVFMSECVSLA